MTQNEDKYSAGANLAPVKSFFVSMLTRDIKLEEAILDLLDNCVDGILRSNKKTTQKKPFAGFWAHIQFNKSSFSISDNCGGIPWALHEYAFRMGRAAERAPEANGTVGVYGIGMKRAIFKIGRECLMQTQNGVDAYEIHITPDWIAKEDHWRIPTVESSSGMKQDGTTIVIDSLNDGVKTQFGVDSEAFASTLERLVASHYAFIIDKGFEVTINGVRVAPRPTKLLFDKAASGKSNASIQPFIFETSTEDGVEIFMAVGFTRPIPSDDELLDETYDSKHSALDAGWTVVCNDRAVLYGDKTELTGWGEANVPRFHNQFIAISGIVEFRSKDASLLPTTTTKRGIDTSSRLYLRTKNKMREGLRMFTDFTNKWKGQAQASKRHVQAAGTPITLEEVKAQAQKVGLRKTTRSDPRGRQFAPNLPMPKKAESDTCRISFSRPRVDIDRVGRHVLPNESATASKVGEKCFDLILQEAE